MAKRSKKRLEKPAKKTSSYLASRQRAVSAKKAEELAKRQKRRSFLKKLFTRVLPKAVVSFVLSCLFVLTGMASRTVADNMAAPEQALKAPTPSLQTEVKTPDHKTILPDGVKTKIAQGVKSVPHLKATPKIKSVVKLKGTPKKPVHSKNHVDSNNGIQQGANERVKAVFHVDSGSDLPIKATPITLNTTVPTAKTVTKPTLLDTAKNEVTQSKKPSDHKWAVSVGFTQDTHYKLSDSDANGDVLTGDVTLYNLDPSNAFVWHIGARSSIETPQKNKKGKQYDTGKSYIGGGFSPREGEDGYFVEGKFGDINQKTANIMSDLKCFVHENLEGLSRSDERFSPPSSSGKILANIAGGYTTQFAKTEIGTSGWHSSLYAKPTIELGTDRRAAGVEGGVLIASTKKASPSQTPLQKKGDVALFAGMGGDYIAYDVKTDKSGTETMQASVLAGAKWHATDSLSVTAEYVQPLTPETATSSSKAAKRFGLRLTYTF